MHSFDEELTPDSPLKGAVTDFGLSESLTNPQRLIRPKGASDHYSPEKAQAFLNQRVWTVEDEVKSDVWAMGLILYQLYKKEFPPTLPLDLQGVAALPGKSLIPEPKPEEAPILHQIWKMTQIDPKDRPSMQETLAWWTASKKVD